MKTLYPIGAILAFILFQLLTVQSIFAQGATCGNPIVIPPNISNYVYANGTTCGFGNNYSINDDSNVNPNLCLATGIFGGDGQGEYITGEEIIFQFTPTNLGCYTVLLESTDSAAIHILEQCPMDPDNIDCLGFGVVNEGLFGGSTTIDITLTFDSNIDYYLVISSDVTVDPCINDFQLTIDLNGTGVLNDICTNAELLNSPMNGNNSCATAEPDAWAPDNYSSCLNGTWSSNENGVWFTYSINAATVQPVSIFLENVMCDDTGGGDIQLGLWADDGTCTLTSNNFISCDVGLSPILGPQNLPIGDYYIFLDGNAGTICDFTLTTSDFQCQDSLFLTTSLQSGTYEAIQFISANSTVNSSSNVEIYAGECILLESGFFNPITTDLEVYIQSCQ